LYVETLVVTDTSVFLDHQRHANTKDQDLVFLHMKIYFTHLMNIVNQRYINSFKNDPELRIYIKTKNFLFLTVEYYFFLPFIFFLNFKFSKTSTSSSWTDPKLVGDINYPTYNGRPVVVTTKTLDAFINYMNSLKLPFAYDHAVGLFKYEKLQLLFFLKIINLKYLSKDLWSDYGYSPSSRLGTVGYASICSICSPYRYSISEEIGGFFYANVNLN
jgi:hypothetical protein